MNSFLYLLALVLVVWAQFKVNGAYARYRNVATRRGYRGVEAARMILIDFSSKLVIVQLKIRCYNTRVRIGGS